MPLYILTIAATETSSCPPLAHHIGATLLQIGVGISGVIGARGQYVIVDAVPHVPSPDDAVAVIDADAVSDEATRAGDHDSGVIDQLDAEVGQMHEGRLMLTETGHDVECLGSALWIPMKRRAAIAHDRGDVEDRGPMAKVMGHVIHASALRPAAELDVGLYPCSVEIRVHDAQCRRGHDAGTLHGHGHGLAAYTFEGRRDLRIKSIIWVLRGMAQPLETSGIGGLNRRAWHSPLGLVETNMGRC